MSDQGIEVYLSRWNNDSLQLLCGIANAGGGRVIVQASEKDYTAGFRRMKRPFETIPKLSQEELGIACLTEPVMDGSQLCLEVSVPNVDEPISYLGDYWLYTDQGNKLLDRQAVEEAMAAADLTSWELHAQPMAQQQDLNADELLRLASIPLSDIDSATSNLENNIESRLTYLHLKDERTQILSNAGVVLLHNNPARFIAGASVRIALFNDQDPEHHMHHEVTGPLHHQLTESLRLIFEEYLPAISTSKAFSRRLPPQAAVREALINALAHKDYESGVPVRVRFYPNRMVIENAGRPPAEWSTEDLLGRHGPRPNNPVIATTLRLCGLMEGWGSGIQNIRQLTVEAGAEEPMFELGADDTMVTFPLPETKRGRDAVRRNNDEDAGRRGAHARLNMRPIRDTMAARTPSEGTAGANRGTSRGATAARQATFAERSIAAANRLDMTNTDEYVLRVLTANGRATAPRIAEVLGVSESTVRRSFRRLREYGFIERIGSNKAGYWSVID